MGGEEFLPLIAVGGRPPPSNGLVIRRGASRLLVWAWKLVLPVLFSILSPPFSCSLPPMLPPYLPWIVDMVRTLFAMKTKGPSNLECLALLPQLIEDLIEFAAVGVGMMLASFLLSSFTVTAVINALAMASKAEKVTFKELFYKITWMCKGLVAALLYVNLLIDRSRREGGRYGLTNECIIVGSSILPSVLVGVLFVAIDMAFYCECRKATETLSGSSFSPLVCRLNLDWVPRLASCAFRYGCYEDERPLLQLHPQSARQEAMPCSKTPTIILSHPPLFLSFIFWNLSLRQGQEEVAGD
ncbi:unnamed protein product [Spirodela intermedia]|uniref:Uncharacterized protein n=1 Tax=Spirodela intermedia TaxID=51605 RepID=A0A7I8KM25_SPIIN|nr:unnamed protein product [Spirodela intermedia]